MNEKDIAGLATSIANAFPIDDDPVMQARRVGIVRSYIEPYVGRAGSPALQ